MVDVLGLDPGLSTGWSLVRFSTSEPPKRLGGGTISGGEFGFHEQLTFIQSDGHPRQIVCERYLPDGTVTGEDGVPSLRIEGMLVAYALDSRTPLHFQTRQDKAALIGGGEPARFSFLRRNGFQGASRHELDAATHAFVWAKRGGYKPVKQLIVEWEEY